MTKTLLAAAAAIALTAAAGQAFAAAEAGATQAVSVASVNFTDRAAVQDFYVRLSAAAVKACDSYASNSRVSAADRMCVDRAVAKAVKVLDRPVLTAMHQDRFGQPERVLASR